QRGRVDRVRSDEGLDVFYVTVVRVLCAGAGPEQSLGTSALKNQLLKPAPVEDLFVDLISRLSTRDGHLTARPFRKVCLLAALCNKFIQQRIHQRINAAYKEAGHR